METTTNMFGPVGSVRCGNSVTCGHRELAHADDGCGACMVATCQCETFNGKFLSSVAWHNTGGNGSASEVWERKVGARHAVVGKMPYRCLVDLWIGDELIVDHEPFEGLTEAKAYADRLLGEKGAK